MDPVRLGSLEVEGMRVHITMDTEATFISESQDKYNRHVELQLTSTPRMESYNTKETEFVEKVTEEVRRTLHYVLGVEHESVSKRLAEE